MSRHLEALERDLRAEQREAAERLKRRARRLGYNKAWVVLAMREE